MKTKPSLDEILAPLAEAYQEWKAHHGVVFNPGAAPLYCSSEWHLLRIKEATLAPAIYSLGFHVSKETGEFWVSIPKLAKYLDSDPKTVRAALHTLVETEFFVILRKEQGKSVVYGVVAHKEWARRHPGRCVVKQEKPLPKSGRGRSTEIR